MTASELIRGYAQFSYNLCVTYSPVSSPSVAVQQMWLSMRVSHSLPLCEERPRKQETRRIPTCNSPVCLIKESWCCGFVVVVVVVVVVNLVACVIAFVCNANTPHLRRLERQKTYMSQVESRKTWRKPAVRNFGLMQRKWFFFCELSLISIRRIVEGWNEKRWRLKACGPLLAGMLEYVLWLECVLHRW